MKVLAKRRFGQHFLRDTGILERIVGFLAPSPNDLIVEIGAGEGALSQRIAPLAARLLAIEIDDDCIPILAAALRPFPSATVVHADVLELNLSDLLSGEASGLGLRFTGNLPYNIGTAIIQRLLTLPLPTRDMVFMVQLEVAERIAAQPGSRQYGYLSVLCQHLSDVRTGFRVSPHCFVPRPKVTSAVFALNPKPRPQAKGSEQGFRKIVSAAFAHRRKTLANALRMDSFVGPGSDELLRRSQIDGRRRPEQISVAEYERLAADFADMRGQKGSAR